MTYSRQLAGGVAGILAMTAQAFAPGAAQSVSRVDLYTQERPILPCKLGRDVEYTKWSGQHSGTITELSFPNSNWHALKNISSFERSNNSCRIEIEGLRLPVDQYYSETEVPRAARKTSKAHDSCAGQSRDGFSVGNVSEDWSDNEGYFYAANDTVFITGVQICNRNRNDASKRTLKGLRVSVQVLEPTILNRGNGLEERQCPLRDWNETDDVRSGFHSVGAGTNSYVVEDLETDGAHESCANWRAMRSCPEGYVGTGIQINENESGVSGIRLQCRKVIPSWTAPPELTSPGNTPAGALKGPGR